MGHISNNPTIKAFNYPPDSFMMDGIFLETLTLEHKNIIINDTLNYFLCYEFS